MDNSEVLIIHPSMNYAQMFLHSEMTVPCCYTVKTQAVWVESQI